MRAVLLTSIVALASASFSSYEEFRAEFRPNLVLGSEEYGFRKSLFDATVAEVAAHNAKGSSYTLAVNRFADWTPEERKAMLGLKRGAHSRSGLKGVSHVPKVTNKDPTPIDWRKTAGVITNVKNQGSCGSCWAFAATAIVESSAAIASNRSAVALSTGQITQCVENPQQCGGTGGCSGGTAELSYAYIKNAGGIVADADYPYTSGGGRTGDCEYPGKGRPVVGVTGYLTSQNNRQALFDLLEKGPISVGVDASSWSFYSSGVFDSCSRQQEVVINHAVGLVGFEISAEGKVVWIIRNSWGSSWGESGYMRLLDTDTCVPDNKPSDGSACKDGPDSIIVCGPCGLYYEVSFPKAKFL